MSGAGHDVEHELTFNLSRHRRRKHGDEWLLQQATYHAAVQFPNARIVALSVSVGDRVVPRDDPDWVIGTFHAVVTTREDQP